jgi:hypothetical protein
MAAGRSHLHKNFHRIWYTSSRQHLSIYINKAAAAVVYFDLVGRSHLVVYLHRRISSSTTGITIRPEHEYVRRRWRKRAGLMGPYKSASLKSSSTSCNAAKIGSSVLKATSYADTDQRPWAAAFRTVRRAASRTSTHGHVD